MVGGAAVSEHPFGPDFTVTSLSYVVSLLPPEMVRDLRLAEHGYHVYPQGPYFAPRRDGRYLHLPDDPARRHERDRQVLQGRRRRVRALGRLARRTWAAWSARCSTRSRRRSARKRPRDLAEQAALLRDAAQRRRPRRVRPDPAVHASIADLVEDRFESDAMRGVLSVSGVIGTWAGPRSAGTAYVMLHHHLGPDRRPGRGAGDSRAAAWAG